MKKTAFPMILGIASLVIIVVVALFTGGKDKVGPKIEFSNDCVNVYSDEDDVNVLLDGVSAIDEKDGDVSGTLRIQNIIVIKNDNRMVVHYSAKDNNNNIGQAERSVEYYGENEYIDFSVLDEKIFADEQESTKFVSDNELQSTSEDVSTSNNMVATESTINVGQETGTTNETETTEPQTTTSPMQNVDVNITPIDRDEVNRTGIPQIRMKYPTLTIKAGEDFYFMDALGEWYDDKDDVTRRVIVGGTYDVNVPGSYELTYYVTDTEGNVSNIEKFTLIVE